MPVPTQLQVGCIWKDKISQITDTMHLASAGSEICGHDAKYPRTYTYNLTGKISYAITQKLQQDPCPQKRL